MHNTTVTGKQKKIGDDASDYILIHFPAR